MNIATRRATICHQLWPVVLLSFVLLLFYSKHPFPDALILQSVTAAIVYGQCYAVFLPLIPMRACQPARWQNADGCRTGCICTGPCAGTPSSGWRSRQLWLFPHFHLQGFIHLWQQLSPFPVRQKAVVGGWGPTVRKRTIRRKLSSKKSISKQFRPLNANFRLKDTVLRVRFYIHYVRHIR